MAEYIVTVNKGVDWQQLHTELTTDTSGSPIANIPDRAVTVIKLRSTNNRITHYDLTDPEADSLKNDSRVMSVEKAGLGFITSDKIQDGNFSKTSNAAGEQQNWGLLRHTSATNIYSTSLNDPGGTYNYVLDGTGVDVVIMDSGIQADHPEFAIPIDPEYNNSALSDVVGDGSDFFKREVTVNGVRIMSAGGVGGQTAVPDAFVEKVARMFELFTDPTGTGINETEQRALIKNLRGDSGTYHAGKPTIQRVARGAGADYSPNFLTDQGVIDWNLTNLFDTHVQNDMVWYLNSTGGAPGDGDQDAQEVIEHVFHTIHMHGLDAQTLKLYPFLSSDWNTGPLYNAMVEAYDGGFWDSSGYGGNAWKTDADAFEVAAKEYLYLLNFCMFEYTELWDGGSLAPEWSDDMRTQAGIQANNPLGYAFHNTYIAPVISKPSLATIRSIFQDGDTGDPTVAGASGYVVDTGSRVKQIDWFAESGVSGTMPANHYTDIDGHGTHVASIMAGKTFGWAKNADIYVQTILDNDTNELSIADAFDTLLGWHNAKTNGRPTVVNMSWGYALYLNTNVSPNTIVDNNLQVYATLTGGSYRGDSPYNNAPHTLTERADLVSKGVTGRNAGSGYYQIPIVMNSVDTSVEQLTDAGIIVCIAAGNNSMKQDVENGDDYNNYVSYSGLYTGNGYYHRGSSPRLGSNPGFNVGAIGNQSPSTTQDEKAGYSDGGAAVNIYAAGTNIIGACSNTAPNFTGSRRVYYLNNSFWQMNIDGTSMASPQIAGMVALLMQIHPDWTPTQVVNWFQNNATNKIYTTGNSDDYTVTNSLWGSEQRLAYFKLSGSKPFQYIAS